MTEKKQTIFDRFAHPKPSDKGTAQQQHADITRQTSTPMPVTRRSPTKNIPTDSD